MFDKEVVRSYTIRPKDKNVQAADKRDVEERKQMLQVPGMKVNENERLLKTAVTVVKPVLR